MPERKPQIGEVWVGNNFSPKEYLVVGTAPNIRLLDRYQTCISVSQQSFSFVYKYERGSLKETCSSCEAKAIVFGLDKRPYCFEHRPRHQVLYFPGDNLDTTPPLWRGFKCPTCKKPFTDTVTIERSLMVSSCECFSSFTPLVIQDFYKESSNDIDPKLLTSVLSVALENFRERGHTHLHLHVTGYLPPSSWRLVIDVFARLQESSLVFTTRDIVRKEVMTLPSFIVVGGRHDLSPEEEDVLHQRLYLGSLWANRKGEELLRVVRMSYDPPGHILCSDLKDPEVAKELREDTLRAEFTRISQKDLAFECPPRRTYNPNPLKTTPSVGDLWYNTEERVYSRVLQVSEDSVKFSLVSDKERKVKYLATLDEFLLEHDASEEHKDWKIGSTYQYGDDQYGELLHFDSHQVLIKYEGVPNAIPVSLFRGAKVVTFRSVLDRLLEDT